MSRLADKPLSWLVDQRAPYIRGANGKNYDAAIDALIERRRDNGESLVRARPSHIPPRAEEDEGRVEVIDYGGKGGKLRIVHPSQ